MDVTTSTGRARHEVRRRPSQERSRERFERIVAAAADLIAERGIEPITMTDIANAAGLAVPALYRYFPNRQAIVRELAQRTFDADAEFSEEVAGIARGATRDDVAEIVAAYCRLGLVDPVRLWVRIAVHADSELSQLDLEGSRTNAALLADVLAESVDGVDRATLERRLLVVVETLDSVIRLAARSPEESEEIIVEFAHATAHALFRPA